jgi:hypothetical protein
MQAIATGKLMERSGRFPNATIGFAMAAQVTGGKPMASNL